jgi:maltooligosyltrehalose trehalohydrolase
VVKLAAATVLCAPYVPLLFMGEEYGETAPFAFFTSFDDATLGEAVRAGRRREYARFAWSDEPPDPQAPATFAACRLDRRRGGAPPGSWLAAWYQALLRLRAEHPALRTPDRERARVARAGDVLALHRWSEDGAAALVVLGYAPAPVRATVAVPDGDFALALDSEAAEFGGAASRAAPRALGGGDALLDLAPSHVLLYLRPAR